MQVEWCAVVGNIWRVGQALLVFILPTYTYISLHPAALVQYYSAVFTTSVLQWSIIERIITCQISIIIPINP